MANTNTKLNNKVRNPKDLSQWLDIWSANITNKDNETNKYKYTIIPSTNWKIPYSYENECLIFENVILAEDALSS